MEPSKGFFFRLFFKKIKYICDMKPINIRLIDDDLVVYAVNVMMFSFEDVCKFTESDWLKVLDRYEM